MALSTLQELCTETCQELYDAEQQLIQALPQLQDAASSSELKSALQQHTETTRNQASRLEEIMRHLGASPSRKQSRAMQSIIQEAQETLRQGGADGAVTDAAIIAAGRKVEHLEMGGYAFATALARQIGDQESARLLQQTFEEEEQADRKMAEIAPQIMSSAAPARRAA